MTTMRITLDRSDSGYLDNHVNVITRIDTVIGPTEFRGRVSYAAQPSWDITQLLQDARGNWKRKRHLGELWEDRENEMWWAQVYGERRDEAQPFYTRAGALDFLDRTAPEWKPRKR